VRRPIQVLIFVYRQTARGREYLMLRRIPELRGFWQPISGGVEDDENLLTAARRELREETGFQTAAVESINYAYRIPAFHDRKLGAAPGADETMPLHTFAARVDDGAEPVLDPAEHDRYLWCPLLLADRLLYWPGDREALRQVDTWLRSRPL